MIPAAICASIGLISWPRQAKPISFWSQEGKGGMNKPILDEVACSLGVAPKSFVPHRWL
jgi:hypothetical protein